MGFRKGLAAVAGVIVASAWLVGSAAPASAAGKCGNGYKLVGTYDIKLQGAEYGTLEISWNSSKGRNCAVAYGRGSTYGAKAYKSVRIKTTGASSWADSDHGEFKYYAGPVYVSARNKCITVLATVKGSGGYGDVRLNGAHCD
ncbi:spore-associated protein A [Nonomuraea sp. B12E4]|uniref:spore-associated protein A n=1 Tax=Nonomuraea sp. B12E4 TaxID=3153564 RepID=UPI00325E7874